MSRKQIQLDPENILKTWIFEHGGTYSLFELIEALNHGTTNAEIAQRFGGVEKGYMGVVVNLLFECRYVLKKELIPALEFWQKLEANMLANMKHESEHPPEEMPGPQNKLHAVKTGPPPKLLIMPGRNRAGSEKAPEKIGPDLQLRRRRRMLPAAKCTEGPK